MMVKCMTFPGFGHHVLTIIWMDMCALWSTHACPAACIPATMSSPKVVNHEVYHGHQPAGVIEHTVTTSTRLLLAILGSTSWLTRLWAPDVFTRGFTALLFGI